MGAKNVLVSRAERGALLADENGGVTMIKNTEGVQVNSVGCGDSMLAGFLAGYAQGGCLSGLMLASACGNAAAYTKVPADSGEIKRIMDIYLSGKDRYITKVR